MLEGSPITDTGIFINLGLVYPSFVLLGSERSLLPLFRRINCKYISSNRYLTLPGCKKKLKEVEVTFGKVVRAVWSQEEEVEGGWGQLKIFPR